MPVLKRIVITRFTQCQRRPTLASVKRFGLILLIALAAKLLYAQQGATPRQQTPTPQVAKPTEKGANKASELPARIELLETSVRFEMNGNSRKEVHARVHINNELGARQFARLNFDYNRSFQEVEMPLVRITHASGGTADILPRAISDEPNPAVVNAHAYQDVRVKSVRVLGLTPGDSLEYQVIMTTTNPPLGPYFALDHSFDTSGVVAQEVFQADIPASLAPEHPVVVRNEQTRAALQSRLFKVTPVWTTQPVKPKEFLPQRADEDGSAGRHLFVKASTPTGSIKKSGQGQDGRVVYLWRRAATATSLDSASANMPDIQFGVSPSGWDFSHKLYNLLRLPDALPEKIRELANQLTHGAESPVEKVERSYDFVSKKIATVDLPLGATGFRPRPLEEILSSGYASPEDKFYLFQALAEACKLRANAVLIGSSKKLGALLFGPATFEHLITWLPDADLWLDPSLEVAPFRTLPASYLGSTGLFVGPFSEASDRTSLVWTQVPKTLPFASSQKVHVDASLDSAGKLTAKVSYEMRGENELLLRVAFHQAPRDKWNEVAQLLALSDGFRGKVTNVTASDPYATKDPLTVEYEITQPKFVDWSKKPVRIPALLPLVGLPDPAPKPAAGAGPSAIDLGTPLEVETQLTLHLPSSTTARTPTGISVDRDYAKFASQYSAKAQTVSASRHLTFMLREVPAERAADYNAFVRAVQNDQGQEITLEQSNSSAGQQSDKN